MKRMNCKENNILKKCTYCFFNFLRVHILRLLVLLIDYYLRKKKKQKILNSLLTSRSLLFAQAPPITTTKGKARAPTTINNCKPARTRIERDNSVR